MRKTCIQHSIRTAVCQSPSTNTRINYYRLPHCELPSCVFVCLLFVFFQNVWCALRILGGKKCTCYFLMDTILLLWFSLYICCCCCCCDFVPIRTCLLLKFERYFLWKMKEKLTYNTHIWIDGTPIPSNQYVYTYTLTQIFELWYVNG